MKIISIDFETYLISEEHPSPRPVCLSWYDGENKGLAVGMEEMRAKLQNILYSNYDMIIAHNAKFELLVIYEWFPEFREKIWETVYNKTWYCTHLYEKLLNNIRKRQSYKLDLGSLVYTYFNEDISASKKDPDAWRLRYSELEGVPKHEWPDAAVDYAIGDSIWAYKVWEIHSKGRQINYKQAIKTDFALNLMSLQGITVDLDRVQTLEREIREYLQPRYDYLIERGICYVDPKDPTKVKKRMKLFREYLIENVTELNYTDKGVVSTTNESLQEYITAKSDPLIENILEIGEYEKVMSAFVSRLNKANPERPLIRSEYNPIVSSGRTSCRTSSIFPSINIQQMPREVKNVTWDIRNCFVPREGFKIVSIDYNGLEMASAAHQIYTTLGWSKMRDTINIGSTPVDMHSKLACQIKSMKENKYCSYEHFMEHKKEPEYKYYRQLSKPINLGFPGGIGYDTMRGLLLRSGINTKLEIHHIARSEQEIMNLLWQYKAKYPYLRSKRLGKDKFALVYDELIALKNQLYKIYPDLEKFLKNHHEKFLTGESINRKNEFGEWEKEPMYAFNVCGVERDYCTYTAFCNGYMMQTPAAIGAKEMMIEIMHKYNHHEDMQPLAFIHDEIIFEVRDNEDMYGIVEDVSEMMIDNMQKVLYSVRIAVEAEIMPHWMKAGGDWSKTYWKDSGADTQLYNLD